MNRRDALKSLAAVPLVGMVNAEKHPIDGGAVVPFELSGWSDPMPLDTAIRGDEAYIEVITRMVDGSVWLSKPYRIKANTTVAIRDGVVVISQFGEWDGVAISTLSRRE